MRRKTLFFLCALLQVLLSVNGKTLYTILAPNSIHSHSKFSVSVTLNEVEGEPDVETKVKDSQTEEDGFETTTKYAGDQIIEFYINGPGLTRSESVSMKPNSTVGVTFSIPHLEPGVYNLTSRGTRGLEFEEVQELQHIIYNPMVYIQTDKQVYKPGDLVQYRIVFMDENTRPAFINGTIMLVVTDAVGNQIKNERIKPIKGVHIGEMNLSENPHFGSWTMTVSINGETITVKLFDIEKYLLPKVDVKIETAKDIAKQDGVIKAIIRAKYTYGKPVKGMATVTIKPAYHYFTGSRGINEMKTVPVDGKAHVAFDLESKLPSFINTLKISVVMTEDLTGNKYNASTTLTVHDEPFKIESIDVPYKYYANKTYRAELVVKNLDGSPAREENTKLKLSLIPGRRASSAFLQSTNPNSVVLEIEKDLDKDGMATFEMDIPKDEGDYFYLEATYAKTIKHLTTIRKAEIGDEPQPDLQLKVLTKNPKYGEDFLVEVRSKNPIPFFVYTLVSKGNIVKSEYVSLPEGATIKQITINPTYEMIPTISLFVFYIKDNKLVSEEKKIAIERTFKNYIHITGTTEAKPGSIAKYSIKTKPNSYVGLLGVDQSVLLLKSGNDFDKDTIFNNIDKYNLKPAKSQYSVYPGKESGLVTITNAVKYLKLSHVYDYFRMPVLRGFPGAMPFALYGAPAQASVLSPNRVSAVPEIKVRKNFDEVWIFDQAKNTVDDGFNYSKTVPDTITSWIVTGFSMNADDGFALTDTPVKTRVFQPFFISTNLPYSVKRGEVISIPVIIYNYMEKDLDVEITMDNKDGEYDFTEATNEVEENALAQLQRVKRVRVPSNAGKSISFMIRPKVVGEVLLSIKAVAPIAGDAIQKILRVEPEGITHHVNNALLINLNNQSEFNSTLQFELPENSVPDSEIVELSVVGDLLGPTMKNLDQLVRMPYGCGEQNMVNFVPNILVLKYMEATSQFMPSVQERGRKFIEVGYQRELTFKHPDGSYSAFGTSDPHGSTWLTAYVIREFERAKPYTLIDNAVLESGFNYILGTQNANGSFAERGKLFDSNHQNELGLTAFVLIALIENADLAAKNMDAIKKAANFIARNIEKEEDLYSLALCYMALRRFGHEEAEKIFAKLEPFAKEDNGLKWWSKQATKPKTGMMFSKPHVNDVEITSYIVLGMLTDKSPADVAPIIKWLISQRNNKGGFSSTQDTVMGLYALSRFAELIGARKGDMKVFFGTYGPDRSTGTFNVNKDNSMIFQTYRLPSSTRKVDFTAQGVGTAMIQLAYRYNVIEKDDEPSFSIATQVSEDAPKNMMHVDVCVEYVPVDAEDTKESNMVVMEMSLPSGYTVDNDYFDKILEVKKVKQTEAKNADSTLVVYYDGLKPREKVCVPVAAGKTHAVAKQKPASIIVYDYYNSARRAVEYYEKVSSLCDICEGEDCGTGCNMG